MYVCMLCQNITKCVLSVLLYIFLSKETAVSNQNFWTNENSRAALEIPLLPQRLTVRMYFGLETLEEIIWTMDRNDTTWHTARETKFIETKDL